MANITINVELRDAETTEAVRRSYTKSPANDYEDARTLDIGTTEETITILSDISAPGPMYIENFGPTNFVEVGYATTVYPHKIPAGEAYMIPLTDSTTTLYLKADTAAVRVKFRIRSQ